LLSTRRWHILILSPTQRLLYQRCDDGTRRLHERAREAPAGLGHRPRRQAMQDMHRVSSYEGPSQTQEALLLLLIGQQVHRTHARGLRRLCRSRFFLIARYPNSHKTRRTTPRLPTRRRTARPRDMVLPAHHRRVLPRVAVADAAFAHALSPPRAAGAIPVYTLRVASRRAHERCAAGREWEEGAELVVVRTA